MNFRKIYRVGAEKMVATDKGIIGYCSGMERARESKFGEVVGARIPYVPYNFGPFRSFP
jgi:hypothetical protein